MTQRRRVKLSADQRTDMWARWKAGQSLHEIGRAFGKDHVSIQFMLAQRGGIAPKPRARRSRFRGRSHWQSGKTFHEELLAASPFGR